MTNLEIGFYFSFWTIECIPLNLFFRTVDRKPQVRSVVGRPEAKLPQQQLPVESSCSTSSGDAASSLEAQLTKLSSLIERRAHLGILIVLNFMVTKVPIEITEWQYYSHQKRFQNV